MVNPHSLELVKSKDELAKLMQCMIRLFPTQDKVDTMVQWFSTLTLATKLPKVLGLNSSMSVNFSLTSEMNPSLAMGRK